MSDPRPQDPPNENDPGVEEHDDDVADDGDT